MEQHNVALLGAGGFAIGAHLPAIAATETLHLSAIYSRSLSSVNALLSAARTHSSTSHALSVYSEDPSTEGLDALLARADIHTVVLALPITAQPAIIERAFRAGKNVVSEKPVAPSLAEAKRLIELYEREYRPLGLQWIVAEQYAYMQAMEKARSLVQAGKIGELRGFSAEVYIQPSAAAGKTGWRSKPDYQGGFILDGGVHFAAGLRHILSPSHSLTSIFARASQIQPHLPPTDSLTGLLTASPSSPSSYTPDPPHDNAPKEVYGTFAFSFGTEKPSNTLLYTFRGSRGVLTVDFSSRRSHVVKLVNFPSATSPPTSPTRNPSQGGEEDETPHELVIELPTLGVEDEFLALGSALVAGAGSGEAEEVERRSGPRAAMRDLGFIEGGLTSSREGREVALRDLGGELFEL
ncbi:hypothetical protein JCM6882_001315 [Rhodosporidiobolus microsporus]